MAYFHMATLALRWAFTKPPTQRYPFTPRRIIDRSRGFLEFNRQTCVFCNVCAKKCPTGALVVNRTAKRWAIDRLQCITCGYCVEVCPKKSLALSTRLGEPAVTKDREVH
jgi:formate hydrogenlyase subunit 6/NADH:ubiquinone oxidoreductase subunit I